MSPHPVAVGAGSRGGARRGEKSLLEDENECCSLSGRCGAEDAPVGNKLAASLIVEARHALLEAQQGVVMNDGRQGRMRNMLFVFTECFILCEAGERTVGEQGAKWEHGCLCLAVMESDAAPVIPVCRRCRQGKAASHLPREPVCQDVVRKLLLHLCPLGGGWRAAPGPGLLVVVGAARGVTLFILHCLHYCGFASLLWRGCFA